MKKWNLVILALIFVIGLFYSGCSGTASETKTSSPSSSPTESKEINKYGGVLKIIRPDGPSTMGSQTDDQATNQHYGLPMMDTLARFDELGNPTFGDGTLLTGMTVSQDGKTVTLSLRKNVKFHDGTDFNAQALLWHFEHLPSKSKAFLKSVKSMEVVDDYTFRFNLSKFDVILLENLPMQYPASPTAAMKPATAETQATLHCVGTGPFTLSSWQRDLYVKYQKFNDYWDKGKPYLDSLEIRAIADPVTRLMALKSGEADILVDVTAEDVADLKASGFKIVSHVGLGPSIVTDGANPDSPFADKRVRMALEYALDRETLAKELGYGFYEPEYQPCYADMGSLSDIEKRKYNPEKAKQLLAEAGYPKGFNTTLIFPSTKAVGAKITQQEALAVLSYLKDVGINATFEVVEYAKYSDLTATGWKGIIFSDALAGPAVFGVTQRRVDVTARMNKSMFMPSEFQALSNSASTEPDAIKRKELFQKMMRMIYDESMFVPLWRKKDIVAMKPTVQDSKYMETTYGYHWYPGNTWISK